MSKSIGTPVSTRKSPKTFIHSFGEGLSASCVARHCHRSWNIAVNKTKVSVLAEFLGQSHEVVPSMLGDSGS